MEILCKYRNTNNSLITILWDSAEEKLLVLDYETETFTHLDYHSGVNTVLSFIESDFLEFEFVNSDLMYVTYEEAQCYRNNFRRALIIEGVLI